MQEKTFSCKIADSNYFGVATLTPASPAQAGRFYCEVLNTITLAHYAREKQFPILDQIKYQQKINILGHNTNTHTVNGATLQIKLDSQPGILIKLQETNFANAEQRLTKLGKLMQKEIYYLWGELDQIRKSSVSGRATNFIAVPGEPATNFKIEITFPPGAFTNPPVVVCSLGGNHYHWDALGKLHNLSYFVLIN